MNINIAPEHVLLNINSGSKKALVAKMLSSVLTIDIDQALDIVMARERLGSTGIGHGVAIPHGRMEALEEPLIVVARHIEGIHFDAIDGAPVHLVVLLLVPSDEERKHLELLAALARLLQNVDVRTALMSAESYEQVLDIFQTSVK
ncbi:MAG: PTS sugar transporter subunit IIA [Mariprofundaceae bacterium]|nr:PTS sugar transporter subunit IIA [Mariprofundaceae bacterium]